MNNNLLELEKLMTENYQSVIRMKNDILVKEQEKQDQLLEFASGIIDVLDSYERVENLLIEKGLEKIEEVSKVINRYKSIQKKLLKLLSSYQITKMEFTDNRLIVGWCEVVDTEPVPNRNNDEIISVIRNGYVRFQKDVIRSAQIIVVKN